MEKVIQILNKILKNIYFYSWSIVFLPIYYLIYLIPKKTNLWIIGDRLGEKYSDNSKALYEYIICYHKEINIIWLTNNRIVYNYLKKKKFPVSYANSLKGIWYSSRADKAFYSVVPKDINTYFSVKAKYVNLTHGSALKKAGYADKRNRPSVKNIITYKLFPFHNMYKVDYYISPASFFEKYWHEESNNYKCKVLNLGYPRNDIFCSIHNENELIASIRKRFPNSIIAFYLPTFRGNADSFKPFESFGFNIDECKKCLEENNIVLLIKAHPGQKTGLLDYGTEYIIEIKENPIVNINEILADADILINDYSSCYFDFLLARKPIILAPFDYNEYLSFSRDLFIDYFKEIEGVIAYNWHDLFKILYNKNYFTPSVEVMLKYNEYFDNKSSERIVNKMKL